MSRSHCLVVTAVVGACMAAGLHVFAGWSATYATQLLEAGAELPLPTQILIASGMFWRRFGTAVTVAFFIGLALYALIWRPR